MYIHRKKIGKPTLIGYQENRPKCYRTENKIQRGIHNKCDVERENIEIATVFKMKNTNNLFGTD